MISGDNIFETRKEESRFFTPSLSKNVMIINNISLGKFSINASKLSGIIVLINHFYLGLKKCEYITKNAGYN